MPDYQDPDEIWSFPVKQFQAIPRSRVRHDPRFEFQIYAQSLTQTEPSTALVSVAQAVAGDDGNSVTVHTFWKKNISTSELSDDLVNFTQICINELDCKLYLASSSQLTIMDISFGLPDKFGHRRVTVVKRDKIIFFSTKLIFFMHPKTDQLLLHSYDDKHIQANGVLDLDKARGSVVDARILGKVSRGFNCANISSHRFSENGNRLAVFNPSLSCLLGTSATDWRSVVQLYSIDGDWTFRLERELDFDSLAFMRELYTAATFAICKLLNRNEMMYQETMFRGNQFKYSFISCDAGVAVVKNFDKWINGGQQKTRYIFLYYSNLDLFRVSPSHKVETVTFVLDSMLYYIVSDRKQIELRLHRLELGDQFKDYRTCANCGFGETWKRRNAQGKRIAQFKVCRECKRLKLHHQWWKYPCHFCSKQCMKQGWKKHKKLHKPYYQSLFLWIPVAIVMLLLWTFFMT